MLKRPLLIALLALVLAVGFCVGLAQLFSLRYEAGEVYPRYSTLRADPVGAKAIHDALAELPGFEVRRNFQPLKKLQPGRPITLVYAGVQRRSFWTDRELQELETLLASGSRVVFAFHPIDFAPPPAEVQREKAEERERKREKVESEEKDDETKDTEKAKKPTSPEFDKDGLISFEKVAERFGFKFEYQPRSQGEVYDRQAFFFASGTPMETDISWHSALHFTELSPEWKALYLSDHKAVIAERTYSRGSILISSDSYFLSNEALRVERHAQLIARVFSGPSLVVFDEEHLGVSETQGVVSLIKKYRLQGVVVGLLAVAGLFVWKNSARFLPPRDDTGRDGGVVSGKTSSEGFANLLHRSVKPADLLRVCVDEWRHGSAHPPAHLAAVEELWAQEQARPPRKRNPVATYRAITAALARR